VSAYFDSAYIAKCYVNEPDSARVRALLHTSGGAHSSSLARAEVAATVLRHLREGALSGKQAFVLQTDFVKDLSAGVWTMIPVSDDFMARVAGRLARMPAETQIRAGDAIHLCAASEAGFTEVWTNDRHMLGAAPAFGVRGISV
jgi:predicted nucleic acid-binding protein